VGASPVLRVCIEGERVNVVILTTEVFLHLDKSAAREARPQAGDEHGEARRVVEEAEEEGSTAGYTDAELRRAIVQAQRRLREFPLAQVTRKLLVELRKEEVRRQGAEASSNVRRKRRTKIPLKLRLKAAGINRSKFLSRTELCKQLGISAPTMRRRAEIDPIFPKAVKPLKGLTRTFYSASDVKEYARVLSMEPNRDRCYTPLALKLKAAGINRSKLLSSTELCERLGISRSRMPYQAKTDPDFPKAVRQTESKFFFYDISDVKKYEQVLATRPKQEREKPRMKSKHKKDENPWNAKLKDLGIDRSKFLSGRELYKWLNVTAPTMYRWMKIDPAFPRALRPFKQQKSITLFSVEDVAEYERVLAARREDLIQARRVRHRERLTRRERAEHLERRGSNAPRHRRCAP
jgi:predicted DNA-binding transcriptional regulator AlpA